MERGRDAGLMLHPTGAEKKINRKKKQRRRG